MDPRIGLAILLGAFFLYLAAKVVRTPIRAFLKLTINTLLGGALLYGWDRLALSSHLTVGVNLWTALTVGFLGAPGFVLVLALKFLTTA